MANRLYNKQVSPKGYKMGGRVKKMGGGMMNKRPMMNKGGKLKMVTNKEGKKVPFYAADGVGKMKKGGRVGLKKGSGKVLNLKKIYMASPEDAKKAMKRASKTKN